jgi:hypothetical protein
MAVVELRGGLLVSAEALALALVLEAQGHTVTAHNGRLRVTHLDRLADPVIPAIRRARFHLLAIAAYEAPEPTAPERRGWS